MHRCREVDRGGIIVIIIMSYIYIVLFKAPKALYSEGGGLTNHQPDRERGWRRERDWVEEREGGWRKGEEIG